MDSPRVIKTEQRGSSNVFYDFILELVLQDFRNILWVIEVGPIHGGRWLRKGMDTRSQESLGFMEEAGYHTLI